MPVNVNCKLVRKENLKSDIIKFVLESKEVTSLAKPGQFLQVKCGRELDPILRRPISISEINKEESTITIIFQVRGKGTKILSEYKEGENVDVVGPLGWGTFDINENDTIAVIGGGIGVFPLLEIAKKSKNNANVYLGFRNKELVVLEEDFKKYTRNVKVATDDGTYAIKGFCTELFKQDVKEKNFKMVYACGPLPMLKLVKNICEEFNLNCQLSLEEKMACGIGACLGCAVKVIEDGEGKYLHVCKDGPVFDARKITFV